MNYCKSWRSHAPTFFEEMLKVSLVCFSTTFQKGKHKLQQLIVWAFRGAFRWTCDMPELLQQDRRNYHKSERNTNKHTWVKSRTERHVGLLCPRFSVYSEKVISDGEINLDEWDHFQAVSSVMGVIFGKGWCRCSMWHILSHIAVAQIRQDQHLRLNQLHTVCFCGFAYPNTGGHTKLNQGERGGFVSIWSISYW